MGQVQSDLYECEARGKTKADDVSKHNAPAAHTKRWPTNQTDGLGGKLAKKRHRAGDKAPTVDQQQGHIRKLSNVSNRNIQLLSMKPRSEKDTYADGLRSRRRSSLINLILGAPARGPRFSEDLCSLSSHMSELCNFGIDYFPDSALPSQATAKHNHYHNATLDRGHQLQRTAQASSSTINSSSLSRLNDSDADLCPRSRLTASAAAANLRGRVSGFRGFAPLDQNSRRRGSSLGSLTSPETKTAATAVADGVSSVLCHRPDCMRPDCAIKSIEAGLKQEMSHGHAEFQNRAGTSIQLDGRQQAAVDSESRRAPNLGSMILSTVDLTSSLDETGTGIDTYQRAGEDESAEFGQYYSNERVTVAAVKKTPSHKSAPLMESARDTGRSQGLEGNSSSSMSSSGPLGTKTKFGSVTGQNEGSGAVSEHFKTVGRHQVSDNLYGRTVKGRINHTARRMIHRSGSELSLYSSASGGSLSRHQAHFNHAYCRRHTPSIESVMLEANHGGSEDAASRGRAHLNEVGAKFASNNDWSSTTTTSATRTTSSPQHLRETKLIIMLQVCLPFILAGFGNMGAGLALNKIAHWEVFRRVPVFFVLLPSFVGLKGNIEMTLASRLSTLSNLNLLDTSYQRRCALLTNLILILSQAIGLSLFAVMASVACEFLIMGNLNLNDHGGTGELLKLTSLVVLPAALVSATTLVVVSSIVMWFAIWLAKKLQVNPDNLSTLMAALYGDVSCVLTYGLFAQLMYALNQDGVIVWPVCIICLAFISWPLLVYIAYQCRETHDLALNSMPPMLAAIVVSLGSGAVLSLVVDKFSRVALYQPVVNGFGANLIAVQASRVSTWLWCNALERLPMEKPQQIPNQNAKVLGDGLKFEFEPSDKKPYGSLASIADLTVPQTESEISQSMVGKHNGNGCALNLTTRSGNLLGWFVRCGKLLLWSFLNPSPNSVAARLLLVMLVPAHSLYFVVIWLVAPPEYIHVTWPFYLVYISLCVAQVFVLLSICQPLMTLLMLKQLDPDIFGISLLMALADLIGTICLTGGFYLLESVGDPNAI